LKSVPAQALQQALKNLEDGFQRFFKGQNGRPDFRRYSADPSFMLPQPSHFKIKNPKGSKRLVRALHLPKMGMRKSCVLGPVEMVQHRPIDGKVKNATISRRGGMWFVSFCIERRVKSKESVEDRLMSGRSVSSLKIVGIDRGVRHPFVTSGGVFLGERVVSKKRLARLARLQRDVSRKMEMLRKRHGIKAGGVLRDKSGERIAYGSGLLRAKERLARFHGKMARVRKDQAHKISCALVAGFDGIVFEDLDVKKMSSAQERGSKPKTSRSLRRGILDVGWSQVAGFVEYKARLAGKMVVRVDPAFSSQECGSCGYTDKKNRPNKGETFRCLSCGFGEHADVNAALTIRNRGIDVLRERLDRPCLRLEALSLDGPLKIEKDLSLEEVEALPLPFVKEKKIR
jgi:putative transposase